MPLVTTYAPRFATPDWIQRATAQTLALPVYRDGALAAPTSGTVSLLDPAGVAVVDEAAVTVSASVATYALLAASVPATLAYSDRWQERWTLLMPDGRTYQFWRDAGLVARRLAPVVSDPDLTALHTELRQWVAEDQSSLQGYIDSAWDLVLLRLMQAGRWPYLILSAWSLREAHLYLSLAHAFTDYASSAAGSADKYGPLAAHYRGLYEKAWSRLTFTYDLAEDGAIGAADEGVSADPVLMLTQPAAWTRWPY